MDVLKKGYSLPIENEDIGTTKTVKEINTGDDFSISFRLDITYLSSEIWEIVKCAIVEGKKNPLFPLNINERWHSDGSGEVEFFVLVLLIWVDRNGISYYIDGAFCDNKNESLEGYFSVPVDLHRYDEDIKTLVHKYVDDTFFMDDSGKEIGYGEAKDRKQTESK